MSKISFGGLEEEGYLTEDQSGEACLVDKDRPPMFSVFSAPYDVTSSYIKGAARGPEALLEASSHMELYDEELGLEPCSQGIETLDDLELEGLSPEDMVEVVRKTSVEIIKKGTIPVMIGGDHSVTTGLVRALKEKYDDLSVLHFDAHADMRDTYEGTPYNHACTGRRIAEICKVVQVGIRSLSIEEAEFLKTAGNVKTYYAKDIKGKDSIYDYKKIAHEIEEFLTDNIFITIDLDVFDPSIMPATGTPEPGGLEWYDVINTIREVIKGKTVVGFDCVELCPIDGMVAPDFMAAKLVYKVMGYVGKERQTDK